MLMADLSRRGFLTTVSVTTGVGIAGGLGLHKLLMGDGSLSAVAEVAPVAASQPATQLPGLGTVRLAGPMLVHIRDLASAEIGMMVGTHELVYRDPELVARLLKTAASAAQAEG
jgi:hypothetical protein